MPPDASSSGPAYRWLMLAGIAVSAWFWLRRARRDSRLPAIYVGGLLGAFVGAKLLYLVIDGWRFLGQSDPWLRWATGKTILGALFGGYLGVELAKYAVGYRATTGDGFALIAPVAITLGRIGCLSQGCCRGRACAPSWFTVRDASQVDRWPAVPAEIAFNLVMIAVFLVLRRLGKWPGQHFHLYLIAYGVFRFFHEFLRDEHRMVGSWTGYQFAAVALTAFGLVAFLRRRRCPPAASA